MLERKASRASSSDLKPNLGELACSCLHGPWFLLNDLSAGQGIASRSRLMGLSFIPHLLERDTSRASFFEIRPYRNTTAWEIFDFWKFPTSSDADVVPVLVIFTIGAVRTIPFMRLKVYYRELPRTIEWITAGTRRLLHCASSEKHAGSPARVELTAWYHGRVSPNQSMEPSPAINSWTRCL